MFVAGLTGLQHEINRTNTVVGILRLATDPKSENEDEHFTPHRSQRTGIQDRSCPARSLSRRICGSGFRAREWPRQLARSAVSGATAACLRDFRRAPKRSATSSIASSRAHDAPCIATLHRRWVLFRSASGCSPQAHCLRAAKAAKSVEQIRLDRHAATDDLPQSALLEIARDARSADRARLLAAHRSTISKHRRSAAEIERLLAHARRSSRAM